MTKTIHLYRLTDAKGDQHITVVNDPGDEGLIGGVGDDGEYHQWERGELYHAHGWAESFGMKLEAGRIDVEVADAAFSAKPAGEQPFVPDPRDGETTTLLSDILAYCEPSWKTHQMSLWNRARRLIHKMKTGETVSPALSFDPARETWAL
jgi:hypothetical protein